MNTKGHGIGADGVVKKQKLTMLNKKKTNFFLPDFPKS